MLSKRPSGCVCFFPSFVSLSLCLSLSSPIIKRQDFSLPLLLFLHVQNISIFVIISFVPTFLMVLFLLPGYLLQICLRISLPKLFLNLPLFVTVLFLVLFPFLNPFPAHILWGCVRRCHVIRIFMVTWHSTLLYRSRFSSMFVSFFSPQLTTSLSPF